MKTTIYALRENHYVRYVGKTIKSLEKRLADHLKEARNGIDTHKGRWIRKMLVSGMAPVITILEVADGDGCQEEIAWIKYFRDGGVELTNATDGGEGYPLTDEIKEKIRIKAKGRKRTPQQIARHKASLTGYRHTPEAKANMKEAKKVWRCTWGDKISKTLMGHPGASQGEKRLTVTVENLKKAWVRRKAKGWVSPRKGYKMSAEEKKKYILAWVKRRQSKR